VTCACGNSFLTRSVKKELALDICSACHPFFTGKQKFVDTAGMVEKFSRKWTSTEAKAAQDRQAKVDAQEKKEAAAKADAAKKAAARQAKSLSAQLPGAGPASLTPNIGQKAAQKAHTGPKPEAKPQPKPEAKKPEGEKKS
jgi:large subunit ribosomal protein L31